MAATGLTKTVSLTSNMTICVNRLLLERESCSTVVFLCFGAGKETGSH